MSEKEYKIKCENLFKKNTILLNQQVIDAEQIRALQKQNGELTDKVKELEKENVELTERADKADLDSVIFFNQLCKAKEIIRDFISVAIDYIDKEDKNYSYIVEAEQFLKENA